MMLREIQHPKLDGEANQRLTAMWLARQTLVGVNSGIDPKLFRLLINFLRLSDSAILEYETARVAYFSYYTSPGLGSTIPVSDLLIPLFSHIENCISNSARAYKVADRIRSFKNASAVPFIDKLHWKFIEQKKENLIKLRDEIQHVDERLLELQPIAATNITDQGFILMGDLSMPLSEFAKSLAMLHKLGLAIIAQL